MKNIKLIVLTTMTMLFLGIGNVNAQQSVLIKGTLYAKYTKIITVLPDYQVIESEIGNVGEKEFLVSLKKELDKWISEGYIVTESTVASHDQTIYSKFYTLIKKDE